MSTTDGAERVITKEVDIKRGGGERGASIQQEIYERREAVEAHRRESEKPRADYLRTGKGDGKQFFDVETNLETIKRFTDQDGAPKPFEEYTESEREKFLRDGELIPAKAKKKEDRVATPEEVRAAEAQPPVRPKFADYTKDGQLDQEKYEKALDAYETAKSEFEKSQSAKQRDESQKPTEQDEEPSHFEGEGAKKWTQKAHDERMESLKSLVQEIHKQGEKDTNAPFNRIKLPTTPKAVNFFMHLIADTRNPRAVLEYIADHKVTEHWIENQWWSDKGIPKIIGDIHAIDRRVGGKRANATASNGSAVNGAVRKEARKLTGAGRPPAEASGGGSSSSDDGSSEAAWRRKDLSTEARGELYRERKNAEEVAARRKRFARR
jgi:hypothetical protein